MKKIVAVMIFLSAFVSTSANAWFFFFLPGSVTGAISDAVTGSEGSNCVGPNAKVGDNIRFPNGSLMVIKSLSGTSSRCTQPEFPIRALLEPSSSPAPTAAPAFTSKAGIDLPDGWAPVELNDKVKAKGYFFQAANRTIDAGLLMSAAKREGITDMLEFAKTKRIAQVAALKDGQGSEIDKILINGLPAWRFEVSGKSPTSGRDLTWLLTFIDAGTEIVDIRAFMFTAGYSSHKEELGHLAYSIKGFVVPETPPVVVNDEKTPVVSEKPHSATDTAASRLKDLNKLYEDGLITKKDFESKKKEILKSI